MMFTHLQLLSVHYPSCDGCARDVEESRMRKEFGRKKRSQGKTERHLYQNMFLWMECFSFVRVQYTRTDKVYWNLLLIDVINVFALYHLRFRWFHGFKSLCYLCCHYLKFHAIQPYKGYERHKSGFGSNFGHYTATICSKVSPNSPQEADCQVWLKKSGWIDPCVFTGPKTSLGPPPDVTLPHKNPNIKVSN